MTDEFQLPHEHVHRSRAALTHLLDGAGTFINANQGHLNVGSIAADELRQYPGHGAPTTAHALCAQAATHAADHAYGLARVLSELVQTFAPWTLARGVLESAATALWLLDSRISSTERIERSLNVRFRHLQDELTFARSAIRPGTPEEPHFRDVPDSVSRRLETLTTTAAELDVSPKLSRAGDGIGFGSGLPDATSLIESTLGEGSTHRLFSAARGRSWAALALSLRPTGTPNAVEQNLTPQAAFYLLFSSMEWCARAVWERSRLQGWNTDELILVFESGFDESGQSDEHRFWRS